MEILHIYGQQTWHDSSTIIGTPQALQQLCDLLSKAITDNAKKDDKAFFASDGEGYFVNVVCLPDNDQHWNQLVLPYHDIDHNSPKPGELYWNASLQKFVPFNF